eukprot:1148435-Pelagomonas_calceolata.AAC.10
MPGSPESLIESQFHFAGAMALPSKQEHESMARTLPLHEPISLLPVILRCTLVNAPEVAACEMCGANREGVIPALDAFPSLPTSRINSDHPDHSHSLKSKETVELPLHELVVDHTGRGQIPRGVKAAETGSASTSTHFPQQLTKIVRLLVLIPPARSSRQSLKDN